MKRRLEAAGFQPHSQRGSHLKLVKETPRVPGRPERPFGTRELFPVCPEEEAYRKRGKRPLRNGKPLLFPMFPVNGHGAFQGFVIPWV
ncbi:hypothetical protein [Thermus caldilimi]|uniref:hypothetical protein n=1 Tax=Thermus caldilimi TaxID=2483360 RepID=UPI003570F6CE